MNISSFGTKDWHSAQLPRIESAFLSFGYRLVKNEFSDLIYSNDSGGYSEAIYQKERFGGKLILNVLDVPYLGNLDEWINENKFKLEKADRITCISYSVKDDIKTFLDLEAEVIHNPIKDITHFGFKRFNPFIYAGRANDSGKRFYLVKDIIKKLNSEIIIVGSENPYFGKYLGVVSDDELNYLYNISKYIVFPSRFEGLGLPPIEAIVAGCIPILTNDNKTFKEFWPEEFLCSQDSDSICDKIIEFERNPPDLSKLSDNFRKTFNKYQIAKNIIEVYNKI
jgi:hypothetical protein